MVSESEEDQERVNGPQIGLKDVLAVVDMAIGEDSGASDFSSLREVFEELRTLIDKTIRGTKIKRFSPKEGTRLFHTFEIHSDGGEVLGYLNMIYLRKPIRRYYRPKQQSSKTGTHPIFCKNSEGQVYFPSVHLFHQIT